MTNRELAEILLDIAQNRKTLYVNGGLGWRLTEGNKAHYINAYSYNRGLLRKPKIQKADADTFAFDCVCLIKAIRMGWNGIGDRGGMTYRGEWDQTEDAILAECTGVSSDFSPIQVGEYLWMPGHVGIYVGDGLAVECTPSWKDGVQVTAVHNIAKRSDYEGRTWKKHGRLPWIDYSRQYMSAAVPVLQYGATGADVKRLQLILNSYGFELDIDGSFGPATRLAVRAYQEDHLLDVDGSVGPATWGSLLC